jgi:hypothetical protein
MARLNEEALRDYEAQLREQGIMDSSERRNKIFGYFANAGYDANEVNAFLDKYGYADGGRVALANGTNPFAEARAMRGRGIPMTKSAQKVLTMEDLIEGDNEDENYFDVQSDINLKAFKPKEDIETEKLETREEKLARLIKEANEDDFDYSKALQSGISGLEMAFGRPIDMRPERTRFGLAEGGIPNVMAMRKTIAELIASGVIDEEDVEEAVAQIRNQAMMSMRAPGMAEGGMMNLGGREMDMRGGGFIPIGAKERADDVPARLSKNEFVMTADAVRAAGGGNINKGAKRMYDLMNKLESKV